MNIKVTILLLGLLFFLKNTFQQAFLSLSDYNIVGHIRNFKHIILSYKLYVSYLTHGGFLKPSLISFNNLHKKLTKLFNESFNILHASNSFLLDSDECGSFGKKQKYI